MEQIFTQMRTLAIASYPLLDELANSPSPGDRLAAVAVLQVFASEQSLPFLVRLVGSEKPFVGYHAIKALHFAVGALDARAHPQLLVALKDARATLESAGVGFDSNRQTLLRDAGQELLTIIESLAAPGPRHD
jgi:HEAT repeat protein